MPIRVGSGWRSRRSPVGCDGRVIPAVKPSLMQEGNSAAPGRGHLRSRSNTLTGPSARGTRQLFPQPVHRRSKGCPQNWLQSPQRPQHHRQLSPGQRTLLEHHCGAKSVRSLRTTRPQPHAQERVLAPQRLVIGGSAGSTQRPGSATWAAANAPHCVDVLGCRAERGRLCSRLFLACRIPQRAQF